MNHLAHFHLSGSCAGRIAGALLADHVRGAVDPSLPPTIAEGVRLHRRIDAFTDAHPAVRSLRRRFPSPERRFAGIAIDIGFDLMLARHWTRFAQEPMDTFCARVHAALRQHAGSLCPPARQHAEAMESHAVLGRYADEAFARGAFLRVCGSIASPEVAARTWQLAMDAEDPLREAFLALYPEAMALAVSATPGTLNAGS